MGDTVAPNLIVEATLKGCTNSFLHDFYNCYTSEGMSLGSFSKSRSVEWNIYSDKDGIRLGVKYGEKVSIALRRKRRECCGMKVILLFRVTMISEHHTSAWSE